MFRRDFEWFAKWVVDNKIDLDKQAMHELTEYFERRNSHFDYDKWTQRINRLHEERREDDRELLKWILASGQSAS